MTVEARSRRMRWSAARTPARVRALVLAAALASVPLAACSDPAGSTEAFCDQVRRVPSLESALSRFDEADPDALAERIEQARSAYAALADAAPDEIAAETDAVVALVDDVLDAVEANPDDPAKAADALRAAMADHPEVEASRAAVTEFAATECDVVLDAELAD